ncbi:PepSY domain-containing protein [Amphritea pacifica]|uniref:PepSY domain-containing protein n=1 Tax=Amphritea pacifica TaxID=2811233 RepID=A0ABS2W3V2_9GAMM|nr:hypothetical protein [Amphritea pacifica]MBN0986286.1 hypothetical protein [Amphritea pacifica]MBN1006977.1 hypothetical protein [Amphritea pacifica]
MKAMMIKIAFLLLLASPVAHSEWVGVKILDAEACRVLVQAGEILSMSDLMRLVSTLSEGKIIDTHLLQKQQLYIYEMEIAAPDGMVSMLYVDARNGDVVDPVVLQNKK